MHPHQHRQHHHTGAEAASVGVLPVTGARSILSEREAEAYGVCLT